MDQRFLFNRSGRYSGSAGGQPGRAQALPDLIRFGGVVRWSLSAAPAPCFRASPGAAGIRTPWPRLKSILPKERSSSYAATEP